MPEPNYNPETAWGRYVRDLLAQHGLSTRAQRIRTGVPHSTVQGWMRDIPPQMPNVLAFARGFGKEVNEALAIAGFPPLPEAEGTAPQERLERELLALLAEYGEEGGRVQRHEGRGALTDQMVDDILHDLRDALDRKSRRPST